MTARETVLYGLALLPVSLFPAFLGLAGPAYFFSAFVLSTALFFISVRAALLRSLASTRQLFLVSVLYLPLLLGVLSLDKISR